MATPKTDELSGVATTGHEWDGLTELNNPLPRWWHYTLYPCIAFGFVYAFFVPPFPGVEGIIPTTRAVLAEQVAAARADQAVFLNGIESSDVAQIRGDDELFAFATAGGAASFAENCTPCHGAGGAGAPPKGLRRHLPVAAQARRRARRPLVCLRKRYRELGAPRQQPRPPPGAHQRAACGMA